VLATATGHFDAGRVRRERHGLALTGLQACSTAPPGCRGMVARRTAGIDVKMITGDHAPPP
jgi:hypothetical protein